MFSGFSSKNKILQKFSDTFIAAALEAHPLKGKAMKDEMTLDFYVLINGLCTIEKNTEKKRVKGQKLFHRNLASG